MCKVNEVLDITFTRNLPINFFLHVTRVAMMKKMMMVKKKWRVLK